MILSDGEILKYIEMGQLVFVKMDKDAINPYNGKYQNRRGRRGRGSIRISGRTKA